jgi:hypothetical protein
MSAKTVTLLAYGNVAGNGPGARKSLPTITMADVFVRVENGTSTPTLDLWLESSDDGGNTWHRLPVDQLWDGSTVTTDQGEIVNAKTTTTDQLFTAKIRHLGSDLIRPNWTLSGGTFDISVILKGK